jgi:DMSO/TMAO reductase YedYZ molybdopterin-dependent catalytic subunit
MAVAITEPKPPASIEDRPVELTQSDPPLSIEELALAFRNRGMPLEGMRYDITPTGLHYLLTHWDIPEVDPQTWSLQIDGAVENALALSLEDIRRRPAVTMPVTMECAGNGRARMTPRSLGQPWLHEAIGTAQWTGTPLRGVLEDAGVRSDAVELVFTGADAGYQGEILQDYQRSLTVADATRPEVLLAYEMNGRPLEPQHGAPLRLLVPGWYGMTSVKWLVRIEAVTERFDGYQQSVAYFLQADEDDPGTPVTRIMPRALMIPPGITEYPARRRFLAPGRVTIRGRAWSGRAPVARVQVGVDGAWSDAILEEPLGEFAWRGWSFAWDATPGEHDLSCRASDAAGNAQPLDPIWNVQGMSNNFVQTVRVIVA